MRVELLLAIIMAAVIAAIPIPGGELWRSPNPIIMPKGGWLMSSEVFHQWCQAEAPLLRKLRSNR